MRPEGVAAAQRELKRTLRAGHRFAASDDLEEIEDAYDTFLTHSGRVYEKLRAACHGQGVDWMWWKKKMDERRDDPLLLYIHKARNTETHRLEASVTWSRVDGARVETLTPLPVTDREGRTYEPPTTHRGCDAFGVMDVNTIIWLGSKHLQALVAEAASRLR